MTKCVTTLISFLSASLFFSQVKINIANTKAILHIDGAKDIPATETPGIAKQLYDFAVTSGGSIGTVTSSSPAKPDITSTYINAIRISDALQEPAQYLRRIATDMGMSCFPLQEYFQPLHKNIATIDESSIPNYQTIVYSGSYIVLTPGTYQDYFTI